MKTDEHIELRIRQFFDGWLEKAYPKLVEAHVNACPHGKWITKMRIFLMALALLIGCGTGYSARTILAQLSLQETSPASVQPKSELPDSNRTHRGPVAPSPDECGPEEVQPCESLEPRWLV